jgi:hypothetical protein
MARTNAARVEAVERVPRRTRSRQTMLTAEVSIETPGAPARVGGLLL